MDTKWYPKYIKNICDMLSIWQTKIWFVIYLTTTSFIHIQNVSKSYCTFSYEISNKKLFLRLESCFAYRKMYMLQKNFLQWLMLRSSFIINLNIGERRKEKIIDYGNEHFSDEFVSIFKICKLKNIKHIKMGSMINFLQI